jgi:hypothetical protein
VSLHSPPIDPARTLPTCPACARRNPAQAAFCYFDGVRLPGRADVAEELVRRGQRFSVPFVFASGRPCHSFDELALACHDCWEEAREALRHGTLEQFLRKLGRLDLAEGAHEAARYPDLDRGLDQLLGRLPGAGLAPPSLRVEPPQVHLGTLRPGEAGHFDLRLFNEGQRLLFGTVRCVEGDWLALGGAAGGLDKMFACSTEQVVPVHVRGQSLRAWQKPLEAVLEVQSSGGTAKVVVRAEVPVRPFPTGPLAGACSPRELADKVRASPHAAAVFLENGAVAQWYQDNGWTYPIQAPTSRGVGAVQQFFEALGLSRAPRVEVSPSVVHLRGPAGSCLRQALQLQALEKRPVWAHGVSNQPWLTVGIAQLDGVNAVLPLLVAAVPDQPGATLDACIKVTTNGNQRLVVPVTLTIEAANPLAMKSAPPQATPILTPPAPEPRTPPKRRRRLWWLRVGPAVLLVAILLGIGLHDFWLQTAGPQGDLPPLLELHFHEGKVGDRLDAQLPEATMRFGLRMITADGAPGAAGRRLTADPWGRTNNTCLRIDGSERLFGLAPGRWMEREAGEWRDARSIGHKGMQSIWAWDDKKVRVRQQVELVRGEESNRPDTCLVRYVIDNDDSNPHTIGIRFLLDTWIGSNDGVPFTIPGESKLCADSRDFRKPVPAFLQALEREDLAHPGVVAHLKLKVGDREPPSRVTLGAWPDDGLHLLLNIPQARGVLTLWEVPVRPMKTLFPYDSAVVLYWDEQPLAPGSNREVAFAYGLGSVAGGDRLLLTIDGSFKPGGELTVTALVRDPAPSETLMLAVPDGFEVQGSASQAVPQTGADSGSRNRPVTWKVRAGPLGSYTFQVHSSTGAAQTKTLRVKETSIFD